MANGLPRECPKGRMGQMRPMRLQQDFLREGGLRERMTRARLAARNRQPPPP